MRRRLRWDEVAEEERRGCRAQAEVLTPDAVLRTISCGKYRRRHGFWHDNKQVRWRGRYIFPENIGEASRRLIGSVWGEQS